MTVCRTTSCHEAVPASTSAGRRSIGTPRRAASSAAAQVAVDGQDAARLARGPRPRPAGPPVAVFSSSSLGAGEHQHRRSAGDNCARMASASGHRDRLPAIGGVRRAKRGGSDRLPPRLGMAAVGAKSAGPSPPPPRPPRPAPTSAGRIHRVAHRGRRLDSRLARTWCRRRPATRPAAEGGKALTIRDSICLNACEHAAHGCLSLAEFGKQAGRNRAAGPPRSAAAGSLAASSSADWSTASVYLGFHAGVAVVGHALSRPSASSAAAGSLRATSGTSCGVHVGRPASRCTSRRGGGASSHRLGRGGCRGRA